MQSCASGYMKCYLTFQAKLSHMLDTTVSSLGRSRHEVLFFQGASQRKTSAQDVIQNFFRGENMTRKTGNRGPSYDPGDYWLGIVIVAVIIAGIAFAVIYEPLAAHFGWPT